MSGPKDGPKELWLVRHLTGILYVGLDRMKWLEFHVPVYLSSEQETAYWLVLKLAPKDARRLQEILSELLGASA